MSIDIKSNLINVALGIPIVITYILLLSVHLNRILTFYLEVIGETLFSIIIIFNLTNWICNKVFVDIKIKKMFNIILFILSFLTTVCFLGLTLKYKDIQYIISSKYEYVNGIPENINYLQGAKSSDETFFINGEYFETNYNDFSEIFYNMNIGIKEKCVVAYLPNSKYIISIYKYDK